jgi:hypothetical protein
LTSPPGVGTFVASQAESHNQLLRSGITVLSRRDPVEGYVLVCRTLGHRPLSGHRPLIRFRNRWATPDLSQNVEQLQHYIYGCRVSGKSGAGLVHSHIVELSIYVRARPDERATAQSCPVRSSQMKLRVTPRSFSFCFAPERLDNTFILQVCHPEAEVIGVCQSGGQGAEQAESDSLLKSPGSVSDRLQSSSKVAV